ncbi:hypothetical protein DXO216_01375 [Xanthomonas oryzae pv. oryzae]|nr:hypothetical protein DXO216_01375 [Xanthomonas oryzae pv. oryzae]OLK09550.1 hypothetical protein IXO599_05375 [Xanthomonas oryzae pv. oryzae]OMO18970.1 hypothetical protein LMG9585_03015 [Xanthomonas oryzae pv. oryzae]
MAAAWCGGRAAGSPRRGLNSMRARRCGCRRWRGLPRDRREVLPLHCHACVRIQLTLPSAASGRLQKKTKAAAARFGDRQCVSLSPGFHARRLYCR